MINVNFESFRYFSLSSKVIYATRIKSLTLSSKQTFVHFNCKLSSSQIALKAFCLQ